MAVMVIRGVRPQAENISVYTTDHGDALVIRVGDRSAILTPDEADELSKGIRRFLARIRKGRRRARKRRSDA